MLFTFCNFKFSVYSSFIVISAYSSLSTSFLKSISGFRKYALMINVLKIMLLICIESLLILMTVYFIF